MRTTLRLLTELFGGRIAIELIRHFWMGTLVETFKHRVGHRLLHLVLRHRG